MNMKNGGKMNYRMMAVLALIAGIFGIALQFMPDGGVLAFMVSVGALGGLAGASKDYAEPERQQLGQSYKVAFEWLLLALMAAYAFILFSSWFAVMEGAVIFLNSRWPSLTISIMCLLMGITGFQRTPGVDSI